MRDSGSGLFYARSESRAARPRQCVLDKAGASCSSLASLSSGSCGPMALATVRDGEMALSQKLVLTAETLYQPRPELTVDGPPLGKFLGLTP